MSRRIHSQMPQTQLYGGLLPHLGEVFEKLAAQKESRIEERNLMPDHVHMMIAIRPKYTVSQGIGYIKSKNAIHLARVYGELNAVSWGSTLGPSIFSRP
jgi:REP element-mobilizing transposase RayT